MRTLLVDDHHLFREGIRLMLDSLLPDLKCEQVDSCEAALAYPPNQFELILLDFHLPGVRSGRKSLLAIRNHFSKARVVVLSGEEAPTIIREVISDGALGFVPKSSSPEVMAAALQLILAGGCYLPPHILDGVGEKVTSEVKGEVLASLSRRQLSVLARAIQGKLNKTIADELNIAEGTVKAHLSAAYKAIGARNRTEAVYLATRYNMRFLDVLEDIDSGDNSSGADSP